MLKIYSIKFDVVCRVNIKNDHNIGVFGKNNNYEIIEVEKKNNSELHRLWYLKDKPLLLNLDIILKI